MELYAIRPVGPITPTADAQLTPQLRAERTALVQATKAVNEVRAFGPTSEVTFSLDRVTHKPLLQIVDRQTGEVISQLPPEYLLRIAAQLK